MSNGEYKDLGSRCCAYHASGGDEERSCGGDEHRDVCAECGEDKCLVLSDGRLLCTSCRCRCARCGGMADSDRLTCIDKLDRNSAPQDRHLYCADCASAVIAHTYARIVRFPCICPRDVDGKRSGIAFNCSHHGSAYMEEIIDTLILGRVIPGRPMGEAGAFCERLAAGLETAAIAIGKARPVPVSTRSIDTGELPGIKCVFEALYGCTLRYRVTVERIRA